MAAAHKDDLDRILGETLPVRPRTTRQRKRETPPLIAEWKKEQPNAFHRWATGQVAAYRVGLVLSYVGMIYFGFQAFIAGIPAFRDTTPYWWTPVWAVVLMTGGLVAAVGAFHAGTEPVTKAVRVFNRIELGGTIALFLTLGAYAAILLTLGYGFGQSERLAAAAGFVALSISPAVRMVWLFFRPGKPHVPTPSENAEA